jgi:molybdopterin-guanine dinucleotide biosynthesis protein A
MGRDKTTLESADGETLLERLLRRLTPLVDVTVVAGRGPLELPRHDLPGRIRFVPDRLPGVGPLAGIEAGMTATGEMPVWVVACDLPDVLLEIGEFLFQTLNGHEAAVPVVGGKAQPLCAVYTGGLCGRVTELLASGKRRMTDLLGSLRVRYVEEAQLQTVDPELRSFANLNTLSDYERWLGRSLN